MKQIAYFVLFSALMISGVSCKSDTKSTTSEPETIFEQKQTNEFSVIEDGPVYSFTVVPDQYDNCQAVFAQSEDDLSSDQFIFASDLRQSCVIALDGRLVQIELVAKQAANLTAQFYEYEGKGYVIDLEIRQTEDVGQNLQKVRGQLKIMDQTGYRDVFYIMGEVKC